MGLVIYWYDFGCIGIVAASFAASLWVICRKEGGSRLDDNAIYHSLLAGRGRLELGEGGGFAVSKPKGHLKSRWLWSSCWKGVHPGWLLVTRFVSLVVMGGFLAWDIVEWDVSIFVYYTEWTFVLVMVYFALGTIISAYGCWVHSTQPSSEKGIWDDLLRRDLEEAGHAHVPVYMEKEIGAIKSSGCYIEEEILQRPGFWGYLMQIAYQTSAGAVILTDIIFWCVIVPFLSNARLGMNLLMGFMHTLNAFFLLLDTGLNNLPFPWFRLSYFVMWSCIYVSFQWAIHACGFSWWPYPFLELSSPWASLWYFAVAVLHIPCFGIYVLIVRAKNSILSRLFPRAFQRLY